MSSSSAPSSSNMASTAAAAAAAAATSTSSLLTAAAASTLQVGPAAALPRRTRTRTRAATSTPAAAAQHRPAPLDTAAISNYNSSSSSSSSSASTSAAAATVSAQDDYSSTQNVVVLGGSYGGMHAATVLAQKLPPTHRVILIDRNSHFNHLYVFPRFSVLPGHEHKAFIPYSSIFSGAPDRCHPQEHDDTQCKRKRKNNNQSTTTASTTSNSSSEPTFDLEMGSTAEVTRKAAASGSAPGSASASASAPSPTHLPLPTSSTSSSSASSSSSSFSLSPIDDDFAQDECRSDLSASSENVTLASSSSLLFDRASSLHRFGGGPHSAASFASTTLSSLYSSRASNDGNDDSAAADNLAELADKLKSRLTLASAGSEEQHQQRSQSEERLSLRPPTDGLAARARSLSAPKKETLELGDVNNPSPLHIHDEAPPAKAVHEQEALGRQPMRVETATSSSSSAAVQGEAEQEQEGEGEKEQAEDAEDKSRSPYAGAPPHVFLQGTVTDIKPDHVLVDIAPAANRSGGAGAEASKRTPLWNITSRSVCIPYTHLVYALGSHLPDPLRTEARTKQQGMHWMREIQERVTDAEDIVLVGGGALGVQFASDIASVHGTATTEPHESCRSSVEEPSTQQKEKKKKKITLIHSRAHLLPNFDERIHEIALRRLEALGVNVVLGERLALTDGCPMGSATVEDRTPFPRPAAGNEGGGGAVVAQPAIVPASASASAASSDTPSLTSTALDVRNASAAELSSAAARPGRKIVRTTKGKLFHADVLLLCTGQQPNSALLAQLSPSSVDPRTRLVKVRRTLQVERLPGTEGWGGVLEAKAPCGDCDCFMDRKVEHDAQHQHQHSATCDCGSTKLVKGGAEDDEEEAEDRTRCMRNVYAIGDVADAFGALNAGYQAWAMADVAAENVLRDLGVGGHSSSKDSIKPLILRRFKPVAPMLKLSLGLGTMAWQGAPVAHRQRKVTDRHAGASADDDASLRSRSGTISDGSTTPTLGASAQQQEEGEWEEVLKPEVMEKEDPFDLGVEGVWKYMANADTSDLYL
ncbi:hypothetical protein OC835_002165 [Tilletia horrida]|nr:hypothetical protein OC835_002165 [Tilletia horrida]